ncbi:threonine--tRNA ligase [Candidatus Micrarchaeota archaeon]|nr:threonine--tRNA ligase [Candidatus Micrarchaeota archaeon]
MRILTIHADFIEVEPVKKAIADAEKIEGKERKRYEEVLVVFTAVEAGDEDVAGSANALADEVEAVAKQVKTKHVLLYPLVHLTSKPSTPRIAQSVVNEAEENLKGRGYDAHHSPFGWYKAYTLKCKGHPLSELSREFGARPVTEKGGEKKPEVSESLKKEAELKSRFYIMDLHGELHEIDRFNFGKYDNLKKFATYETKKVRAYEKEPPHIKIMKEHGLIDFEPGSDPGNFRHLPKGKLIKKLLEDEITDICVNRCGALEVETPIMYDFEHPALKKYLNRFPARQYVVLSEDKRLFLRFAACFGQFLIAHDLVISYKQLPMKMYELTRYSFRREQSGELAGLKRLRAFTMPDMHTFAADIGQAKEEFEKQFDIGLGWLGELGLDAEVGFRIQDDFFKENKEWYVRMAKRFGRPILVELFKERYAYFITKFEFNFVDIMEKASALTTVQIDVENADTYDINYVDRDGQKKRPLILHASLSGSIERNIYALLENEALKMAKGQKAMLPLWLSPTQVRVIPVSEGQKEHARKIMEGIDKARVRVDFDDRDETLGKKIRDAQKEWIPYIVVIGEKEIESKKLSVSIRKNDEKKEMTAAELVKLIEEETGGKPFERLSLPRDISKRPII